jgi:hypothetical protein
MNSHFISFDELQNKDPYAAPTPISMLGWFMDRVKSSVATVDPADPADTSDVGVIEPPIVQPPPPEERRTLLDGPGGLTTFSDPTTLPDWIDGRISPPKTPYRATSLFGVQLTPGNAAESAEGSVAWAALNYALSPALSAVSRMTDYSATEEKPDESVKAMGLVAQQQQAASTTTQVDADGTGVQATMAQRTVSVTHALKRLRGEGISREYWMKDENCKECYECKAQFSVLRRRHHCRICGILLCMSSHK